MKSSWTNIENAQGACEASRRSGSDLSPLPIVGSTRLEDVMTLAEVFARAGYDTAAFVGNVMLNRRLGFDRGFAVYDDELPTREGARHLFERRADATTARAIAWLDSRGDAPFFRGGYYQDSHGPDTPPEGFACFHHSSDGELYGLWMIEELPSTATS